VPGKKTFIEMFRPTLHAAGLITHGFEECLYLSDSNVPKDSNQEIDILSRGIERVWQHCDERGISTPEHICIQADNCAREMKNQYTLFYGILLCHCDIVKSVTFSYLRKGHTHEDIGLQIGNVSGVPKLNMFCHCLPKHEDFNSVTNKFCECLHISVISP
jgi:hypothetical protein